LQQSACGLLFGRFVTNLVPLLLELGIFEDLGHKQSSMQGWVGVHGASNGLHQQNLSAATQDQDLNPMAGASNKKQPRAIAGASGRQMECSGKSSVGPAKLSKRLQVLL